MPDFSYLASLAVFTFGALALSVLTVFYWTERRRRSATQSAVLRIFTLVCAIAFVNNLLDQTGMLQGVGPVLVRDLSAGLLPALILHLVVEFVSHGRRGPGWLGILVAFYGGGSVASVAAGLDETGLLSVPGIAGVHVPAVLLLGATMPAILGLAMMRRPLRPGERSYRRALIAVLIPMLVCAAANLGEPGALVRQLPDYLVLAFFCVTLYFRERLAFIDLLVKRGAFFATGLAILFGSLLAGAFWMRSVYGIGILLLGPLVYERIDRAIDAVWLRRPYAPIEAERQFIREIQAAATEDELRTAAGRGLEAIFRAKPEVRFGGVVSKDEAVEDGSLATSVEANSSNAGSIVVAPRPDGIPFLSDDRRLLQSLAGALGVVLENVQFRADRRRQEEREQQLRWLTSRAELKALRAQINPHFLFNALSVIAGLIQYDPELAAGTIDELAQVFRYTLRKSTHEWAPLAEEMEFVAAYLRIEQARFGERLKVELQIDPAACPIPIPAMSIQPLIENAIKHGISGRQDGIVGLRAALDGELVSIEVFDNGPGFPPEFSLEDYGEGHGLRNVMERLRGYYGEAARLWWKCGPDGTVVGLTFPQCTLSSAAIGDTNRARSDRR